MQHSFDGDAIKLPGIYTSKLEDKWTKLRALIDPAISYTAAIDDKHADWNIQMVASIGHSTISMYNMNPRGVENYINSLYHHKDGSYSVPHGFD